MNSTISDNLKDNNIQIEISVALGSAEIKIGQLLKLGRGSVVELDRNIDEHVDIYANDVLIGHGEIVITNNEQIGISIIEIIK